MLNWFRGAPKSPIETQAKAWIDDRFTLLAEQFGIEALLSSRTILPTAEFLPDRYEATAEAIDDLMRRVATFLDVDPESLVLSYYDDEQRVFGEEAIANSQSGDDHEIWLEVNSLLNPAGVVAALSREIARVRLIRKNRELALDDDQEELAELFAVFHGVGIFLANTALVDSSWTSEGWTGWSMGRLSHMSMNMFGYAMGLYALARGERRPDWVRHLRPDVRAPLQQAIRYIESTGDCDFAPAVN